MKSALLLAATALSILPAMSADTDYASVIPVLEAAVKKEIADYGIGGISLALTDGQRLVHAAGYGEAQRDSVFRAGSVSKLFNAIAVMQQVEAGKLSLDAPFSSLPGAVLPVNPFAGTPAITLRQMLCHRSGIQRESPVGGYFDDSQPSQKATCESVRDCVVVTPPNAKTRYSNIVPTLAGETVAVASGQSFEDYQKQHIFQPLGMMRSAWRIKDVPGGQVLKSRLRVADGKGGFTHEECPLFDLGTVPAGNLFTTAPDLAAFIMMLDAKGAAPAGRILREESLAQMWKPQLVPDGSFGLGFALGKFREHPTVGHNGAVYGHSTALLYLPDVRLGVVVIGNEDIVNARIGKLANLGLSLMLERKTGEQPAAAPAAVTLGAEELEAYAGGYESQSFWCELSAKNGRLEGSYSGQPCVLTPVGTDTFLLSSRIHDDVSCTFSLTPGGGAAFSAGAQKFTRGGFKRTGIPEEWRRFLGCYGPKFIPIVVHEKWGRLYATTENMVDYRMTPVNWQTFLLPPGMYDDEHAVFQTGHDGAVHSLNFCNMVLPRWK